MNSKGKKRLRIFIILAISGLLVIGAIAATIIMKTKGRTQIQVDIHQNKDLIYLSTFSEPPQFAIWLENPETKELKTLFVTHRVAIGDWEGKANVPVALPHWFELFRGKGKSLVVKDDGDKMSITGATPKEDYFTIRAEVKPGTKWNLWIEMNLAGDYNDAFPEFDRANYMEDEFACGQPALLYKAEIVATENMKFTPVLEAQSIWDKGENRIEPVSEGVTTARNVFDNIQVSIIRPKPKLIEKYKLEDAKI